MSEDDLRSRSIARVLEVLEQLSVAPQPLSNHTLARRLGVPASSMFRLLQKLAELGYVDFDDSGATYAVSGRLGELGERLADAGCRSLPMRNLLMGLRDLTGYNAMVWVPSGIHVRLAAIVSGKIERGLAAIPGELSPPFDTPGLAIALTYTDAEVRAVARQCRRRGIEFGQRFRTTAEVLQGLRSLRPRGHVPGYNIMADGWAMLAWPIPIPVRLDPNRVGAVALGSRVPMMRRDERRILQLAEPLLAEYRSAVMKDNPLPAS